MKMKIVKVSEMDRITKEKYIKEVKFFLKDLNLEYPLHDIWYEKMIQSMEEKFEAIKLITYKKTSNLYILVYN